MAYYDGVDVLRERLTDAGEHDWSQRVLDAERSASTAGELISNVAPLIRQLLDTDVANNAEIRRLAESALAELDRTWDRMNGKGKCR